MACQVCYVRKQKCSTNARPRTIKKVKVEDSDSIDDTVLHVALPAQSEMFEPAPAPEGVVFLSEETNDATTDLRSSSSDMEVDDSKEGPRMLMESGACCASPRTITIINHIDQTA